MRKKGNARPFENVRMSVCRGSIPAACNHYLLFKRKLLILLYVYKFRGGKNPIFHFKIDANRKKIT